MIKDGEIYARYDVKKGRKAPNDFIAAQNPDAITGHWPGWVRCDRNNPNYKYHFEAMDNYPYLSVANGTYELCGPKI